MAHYDLIVVGGGPAGTTVASLVRKYSPHLRVLLLEKEVFPRHHVGESLLAGASPVLRDMGAYDRINHYGFIEKAGATYVWGRERTPWGFNFDRVVKPLLDRNIPLPDMYTKGWQVRRAEYDHQLLQHTADMGAEVHEGARVTRVIRDGDDRLPARITGVEYRDDSGLHTASCTWLVDCSGQDALIGRDLKLRDYSEKMNNYALFGYWKDFNWIEDLMGHRLFTRIFIATSPRGWLWCIPASSSMLSIGLVTTREVLQQAKSDPMQLYLAEIEGCPEIAAILNGAKLDKLYEEQNNPLFAVQDWSYTSRQMYGAGWTMVGDAAGFVDPILSSGVMIAHEMGQKAAYTINSIFRAGTDSAVDKYWQFYQTTYNTYLDAYRSMAEFWYGNNFLMESWWWEAQRSLKRDDSAAPELGESVAFMLLASGYANRAESLSLFGSYPLEEAQALVNGLFGLPHEQVDIQSAYASRALRLTDDMQLTDGMYYFQGYVRSTRRVTNHANGKYLDLHPAEDVLLRLFDGAHTLADLNAMVENIRGKGSPMPIRSGIDLLVQLDEIGVLA